MTLGYVGSDWQEEVVNDLKTRQFDGGDVWPHGAGSAAGGGNKDALTNGAHSFLAIGPQTVANGRTVNTDVGVVITYDVDTARPNLITASGFASQALVANALTYTDNDTVLTFETSIEAGRLVYLDDSDVLGSTVTLSVSPLNGDGDANPVAGRIRRGQDDFADAGVGGAGAATTFPIVVANSLVITTVAVELI